MIIDIHTHYVSPTYLSSFSSGSTTVTYASNGDLLLQVGGRHAPPMPREVYDVEARLTAMSNLGVDLQVICPPPVLFLYEANPQETLASCQVLNDSTAKLCKQFPSRFLGLGTVPLQDENLAVAEMVRCTQELGLPGVVVATHVDARYLDHPNLRNFLHEAERLGAFVLVHPRNPPGAESLQGYYLSNTIGNPIDTTVCIARLIHSGALDTLPNIKLCFAHGGGYAAFGAGRLEHAWRGRPDLQAASRRPPSDYLSRLYFDSCTHSAPALGLLVATVGATQVLMGSDAPQDMADPLPLKTLEQAPGLSNEDRQLISSINARALLGLQTT